MDDENITDLLRALDTWHDAERVAQTRTRERWNFGERDMSAVLLLIDATRTQDTVTPRDLAHHLRITNAGVTHLIDRLEHAGHIIRDTHPSDGRSNTIRIVAETAAAVRGSLEADRAQRFDLVAALTPAERATITSFLLALTQIAVEE